MGIAANGRGQHSRKYLENASYEFEQRMLLKAPTKERRMNIRVFYIRDASKFPVACVATRVIDERPGVKTPEIEFALAIHNPKDTFDKVRGREIAVGRLEKHKIQGYVGKEAGASKRILELIARDEKLPQRVREAAKYRAASYSIVRRLLRGTPSLRDGENVVEGEYL